MNEMAGDGVWAIVQARMGSSRLPGKVMKDLAGVPVLGRVLERVAAAPSIWGTVVATTVSERDDPIEAYCDRVGVRCYRGSERDVLDRYARCADAIGAETIVRVTSDCPLVDPDLLEFVVGVFLGEGGRVDYCGNVLPPTFPDGLDVEVFSVEALVRSWMDAADASEREHVTLHFWRNANRFRLMNVVSPVDHSALRWTLDTAWDLESIRGIYRGLRTCGREVFGMEEVLSWLARREEPLDPAVRAVRRQNSLSIGELQEMLDGWSIPAVIYQPVTARGEET